MREMVHAAHIVHRVVDGGRRDVHAMRLPQGLRQNFRRERGLGRIWLQLTVRLVLGGVSETKSAIITPSMSLSTKWRRASAE